MSQEIDYPNTFTILIASDIHLGYAEKDVLRGSDSIVAFEELLQIANEKGADFILLGGDLFHENRPSRQVMHECVSLLRKYCLGERPCSVVFMSDPSINFSHCKFHDVNYEDPNLQVCLPVFSIHGNHDDPAGPGTLCSLDILSSSGLVNYFGKTTSLEEVTVFPVCLSKGRTKLALYGLGSIRDERLNRLFRSRAVKFMRPTLTPDDWFNLVVLHQNRAKHGANNYIPEEMLSDFIDLGEKIGLPIQVITHCLVFWGHEHECRIDPEYCQAKNFHVTQPGSTVATSLSEFESKPKHVGLLHICFNPESERQREFMIEKIPLGSVRQFYFEDVCLGDTGLDADDPDCTSQVEELIAQKVDDYLQRAANERSGHPKQPKEPLIRIRIDYSGGFEPFSVHRFGQRFVKRVANPKDMLLFHRRRSGKTDEKDAFEMDLDEESDVIRVEDVVEKLLAGEQKLSLFSDFNAAAAVKSFVEKDLKDSIERLAKFEMQSAKDFLCQRKTSEERIGDDVSLFRAQQSNKINKVAHADAFEKQLQKTNIQTAPVPSSARNDVDMVDTDLLDETEDLEASNATQSCRSRGRGGRRGRGRPRGTASTRRTGRGRARGRGATQRSTLDESTELVVPESESFTTATSKRSSGRSSSRKQQPVYCLSDSEEDNAAAPFSINSSHHVMKQTRRRRNTSDSDFDELETPRTKQTPRKRVR